VETATRFVLHLAVVVRRVALSRIQWFCRSWMKGSVAVECLLSMVSM
jgi:hypothetical protein